MEVEREWSLLEKLEGRDAALNMLSETMFLGSLISAGASLVGGLFGKSSQDKKDKAAARAQQDNDRLNNLRVANMNADVRARAEAAAKVPVVTNSWQDSSVDMDGFLAAAEKGGFNPITFLRSGGLSAFTKSRGTVATTGEGAMTAALSGSQIFQSGAPYQPQAPGYGEVFGNAIAQGGQAFAGALQQQQQNQFQMDLMNAQLGSINRGQQQYKATGGKYGSSSGAPSQRSGYVPTAIQSGPTVTGNGSAALTGYKNPGDMLCMGGVCWGTDPKTSSADDYETRYGDLGGSIAGAGVAAADLDRWLTSGGRDGKLPMTGAGYDFGAMLRSKGLDIYNALKPVFTSNPAAMKQFGGGSPTFQSWSW